jgi:hypothetical protein
VLKAHPDVLDDGALLFKLINRGAEGACRGCSSVELGVAALEVAPAYCCMSLEAQALLADGVAATGHAELLIEGRGFFCLVRAVPPVTVE